MLLQKRFDYGARNAPPLSEEISFEKRFLLSPKRVLTKD
jgi:hypothetical protein